MDMSYEAKLEKSSQRMRELKEILKARKPIDQEALKAEIMDEAKTMVENRVSEVPSVDQAALKDEIMGEAETMISEKVSEIPSVDEDALEARIMDKTEVKINDKVADLQKSFESLEGVDVAAMSEAFEKLKDLNPDTISADVLKSVNTILDELRELVVANKNELDGDIVSVLERVDNLTTEINNNKNTADGDIITVLEKISGLTDTVFSNKDELDGNIVTALEKIEDNAEQIAANTKKANANAEQADANTKQIKAVDDFNDMRSNAIVDKFIDMEKVLDGLVSSEFDISNEEAPEEVKDEVIAQAETEDQDGVVDTARIEAQAFANPSEEAYNDLNADESVVNEDPANDNHEISDEDYADAIVEEPSPAPEAQASGWWG
jgi:cytochrome c556